MTISSSLNAGVAGLAANASRLATIADNIANSATYGYKRAEADFSSLVIEGGRGTYSAGGREKPKMEVPTGRTSANGPDVSVLQRSVPPETVNVYKNFKPALRDKGSDAEKVDSGILRRTDGSDSYLERTHYQTKETETWPGKISGEFTSKVSPVLVHSHSATPDEVSKIVSLDGLEALPIDDRSIQDAGRRPDSAQKIELQPRQVISQLASAVGKVMPDGTLEIRLSPEDLGRVRVTIVPGDLGLSVQLIVERGDTLDLVRRHIDILERDLLEQGYSDMSFSAGQEQPNPDQERPPETGTLLAERIAEPNQIPDLSNPQSNEGVTLSRLDIRL